MNKASIAIPDLSSYCGNRFRLRMSRHRKDISSQSKKWFFYADHSSIEKNNAYNGLNPGLLVSVCYPHGGFPQLRVATDFLTYLFYFDNISDEMDNITICDASNIVMNSLHDPWSFQTSLRIGTMARDFYKRMLATASEGCQRRFLETMKKFLQSVDQQARDRINGHIPTFSEYVVLRRDTSGCKSCWAMIEYAYNLSLPDEVMKHPIIRTLESAANDLVSWSNDIFSYNREQAKGDTHNLLKVLINEHGISVEEAANRASTLCKQSIDAFVRNRELLPSWGGSVDHDVEKYVEGLSSWIIGILYWSFKTERYFGKDQALIKAAGRVRLLTSTEWKEHSKDDKRVKYS